MTVTAHPSAARLAGAGWDELLGPGDGPLSTGWLRLVESSLAQRPVYLTAGEPAAAGLPGYVIRPGDAVLEFARPDLVLARVLEAAGLLDADARALLAGLMPTLSCGARQVGFSRLARRPGEPRPPVADLLESAAEHAAKAGAASMSMLYVDASDDQLCTALARAGFAAFPSEPGAVLDVTWTDFDGYLATLPGTRRVKARRERRRVAAAGIQVRVRQNSAELAPLLAPLNNNLMSKYGARVPVAQTERSLRGLARNLGEAALVVTAETQDRVVGFMTVARWRDELYTLSGGFDYERTQGVPLYFDVVFYEIADYAARNGCRLIDYGCGALDTKLSRGCRAVPHLAFVHALDPGARKALHDLADRLRQTPPGPATATGDTA